ncbi:MAG: hypothetical protein U9R58_05080 [Chloroflexota bacterium]|nr:hypothetical protein [Chloroflexota bacterium]
MERATGSSSSRHFNGCCDASGGGRPCADGRHARSEPRRQRLARSKRVERDARPCARAASDLESRGCFVAGTRHGAEQHGVCHRGQRERCVRGRRFHQRRRELERGLYRAVERRDVARARHGAEQHGACHRGQRERFVRGRQFHRRRRELERGPYRTLGRRDVAGARYGAE